jgi:hypothetical protein
VIGWGGYKIVWNGTQCNLIFPHRLQVLGIEVMERSKCHKEYADKRYAEITSAYRKNNTVTIEEVISRHRPHEDFIKLYESNVAKEQQEAQLKALRDARNAQGELLAKVYNTQAYQAVHDPNGCLINRSLH